MSSDGSAPSPALQPRSWVPDPCEQLVQGYARSTAAASPGEIDDLLHRLIDDNRRIHDRECINLNPATNIMNPRAEAALASGIGARPSLGYPGDKYEMGLEAVEHIEVIAAELAAETFDADYAEIRVASGAMANLYAFMACAKPGDAIIVPPATVGGHVTHNEAGAAGLYGLEIHEAPIDAERYTVDAAGVAALARKVRPAIISVGASLNLTHHPVAELRSVADEVGATLLFDAAHLSGPIAGGAWPNPLHEGADLMTMSTYKSLGGPPAGVLVTNDAALAERVDAIAFPGLTANFDAAKSASLAITLLDWKTTGAAYAADMVSCASTLAAALAEAGVPVFATPSGPTLSHAFALDTTTWPHGDGHALAKHLRNANLLACAIGLPNDPSAGLRLGTNEAVRLGFTGQDQPALAELIAEAWRLSPGDPALVELASRVTAFRAAVTSRS